MNKINYQKELDKIIASLSEEFRPKLLLHSCCAPCSSYCITYLREYFDITCYFYNPNITGFAEYEKRYSELVRLSELVNNEPYKNELLTLPGDIKVIDAGYDDRLFFESVKGYEEIPEGGKRCEICFRQRLEGCAIKAKEEGFDYFATTLTISPLKDEQLINSIGRDLSKKYDIPYLFSDFKKKGGYLESIKLSEKYGLYRQDYCGCVYSLRKDYKKV